MSERIDQKLQEVAVARYGYRHEAEFAAGFLEDAGIPFRLQLDDPAMGLSISASATIWVVAMDAEEAREVLDIDDSGTPTLLAKSSRSERKAGRGSEAGRGMVHASSASIGDSRRGGTPVGRKPRQLTMRERVFSVMGAMGLAGAGMFAFADGGSLIVQGVVAAAVVGLNLIGLIGRAPAPVRRLLAALAGTDLE